MSFTALPLAALAITVWSHSAIGESAIDAWSLTGLKFQSVPSIWILDGTELDRVSPREGEGFLEIQGRLTVRPGARLDPFALPEIRLRTAGSAANVRPQSAFAVGSSIALCRYLPPEPRMLEVSKMTVGQDGSLAVSRESPSAPLKLTVVASSVDLCIAFSRPATVGESLLLELGGQSFTVPLAGKPKQTTDPAKSLPPTSAGTSPISWSTLLIAAICLLVVGLGARALWRRRARPLPVVLAKDSEGESANALSGPRRVSEEHCQTRFTRVGANVGPGKADFEAALREIQAERFSETDVLLAQAITKGLPVTYECGAWAMRGQAAVGLGNIELAIDYFLNALGGRELTTQAALPAALHLAVIYRALGLRADAEKMDAVARAAYGKAIVPQPEAIKRIQKHTHAYRRRLRAARPSGLRGLVTRWFKRSPSA